MPRFNAGIRTGAGSSTLPIISLYGAASNGGNIVEIEVFNTTAIAVSFKIVRLSTAGTSSAITGFLEADQDMLAAACTPRGTHSSTGPTIAQDGYFATLAAAVGAGIIWTFGDRGLRVPTGTGNGIGVVPVGTGQICDASITWDE